MKNYYLAMVMNKFEDTFKLSDRCLLQHIPISIDLAPMVGFLPVYPDLPTLVEAHPDAPYFEIQVREEDVEGGQG